MKQGKRRVPSRFVLPRSSFVLYGTIDAEHQELIDILNRWLDSLNEVPSGERHISLDNELRQKLAAHFVNEERAMQATNYPDLSQHRLHHQHILENVTAICEAAQKGDLMAVHEIQLLFASLVDDVLRADLHFKTYLESRGLIPT